jgi:hypothetical protein
MDFIEGLLVSQGYLVILVVVDRYTKYAHFYPLKHLFTVGSVVVVFLDNVVKLHGIPMSIVSEIKCSLVHYRRPYSVLYKPSCS